MKRRAVVTGATGFVGCNLARRLLADGHEVHVFVRPEHATWRLEDLLPSIHQHVVSLVDRAGVASAVERVKPDWVFHLAVHGAYPTQSDVHAIFETNVLGTVNMVEASLATGFEAFVNTGSSSEYGYKDHPPGEQTWLEPNSHYAASKAAATLFCRHTAQSRRVHLPTLRLYSVFGPYEEPSRLLPTLAIRGLAGELPPLASPDIARDFVYVDDVVDAYLLAATVKEQEPGAVYNVGSGVQTRLEDIVGVVRRVLGVSAEPSWGSMPQRKWDTTTWVSDPAFIQRSLGWKPAHDVERGFRSFVEWFRDRPERIELYTRRQRAVAPR